MREIFGWEAEALAEDGMSEMAEKVEMGAVRRTVLLPAPAETVWAALTATSTSSPSPAARSW
ncbi:MAG: hypothetical protein LC792_26335 [Actinobacteria bacterium]|nr:hypothetical protein [Actinomycetota bacterium]